MSDRYGNYDRHPIQLSEHTIALIKLYSRTDYLEDCFVVDMSEHVCMKNKDYKKAAQQFINQLEGRWNGVFIDYLIEELSQERDRYYHRIGKKGLYHIIKKYIDNHNRISIKKKK